MRKYFILPVLILVFILSGCKGGDDPSTSGKTGITGEVFLAECQGDQVATDCFSQEPYQATLILYNSRVEEIARIETAEDGTFEYEVEPGVYLLHPESPAMYPIATDYQIVVVEGEMTEMTIIYDSGVR